MPQGHIAGSSPRRRRRCWGTQKQRRKTGQGAMKTTRHRRRSSNCIDPSIRSPRRWNAAGDGDQTMGHKCVLWSFLRGVWSSTTVSGICVVLCCLVLCCLVLPSAVLVAKQEKKWRFRWSVGGDKKWWFQRLFGDKRVFVEEGIFLAGLRGKVYSTLRGGKVLGLELV